MAEGQAIVPQRDFEDALFFNHKKGGSMMTNSEITVAVIAFLFIVVLIEWILIRP